MSEIDDFLKDKDKNNYCLYKILYITDGGKLFITNEHKSVPLSFLGQVMYCVTTLYAEIEGNEVLFNLLRTTQNNDLFLQLERNYDAYINTLKDSGNTGKKLNAKDFTNLLSDYAKFCKKIVEIYKPTDINIGDALKNHKISAYTKGVLSDVFNEPDPVIIKKAVRRNFYKYIDDNNFDSINVLYFKDNGLIVSAYSSSNKGDNWFFFDYLDIYIRKNDLVKNFFNGIGKKFKDQIEDILSLIKPLKNILKNIERKKKLPTYSEADILSKIQALEYQYNTKARECVKKYKIMVQGNINEYAKQFEKGGEDNILRQGIINVLGDEIIIEYTSTDEENKEIIDEIDKFIKKNNQDKFIIEDVEKIISEYKIPEDERKKIFKVIRSIVNPKDPYTGTNDENIKIMEKKIIDYYNNFIDDNYTDNEGGVPPYIHDELASYIQNITDDLLQLKYPRQLDDSTRELIRMVTAGPIQEYKEKLIDKDTFDKRILNIKQLYGLGIKKKELNSFISELISGYTKKLYKPIPENILNEIKIIARGMLDKSINQAQYTDKLSQLKMHYLGIYGAEQINNALNESIVNAKNDIIQEEETKKRKNLLAQQEAENKLKQEKTTNEMELIALQQKEKQIKEQQEKLARNEELLLAKKAAAENEINLLKQQTLLDINTKTLQLEAGINKLNADNEELKQKIDEYNKNIEKLTKKEAEILQVQRDIKTEKDKINKDKIELENERTKLVENETLTKRQIDKRELELNKRSENLEKRESELQNKTSLTDIELKKIQKDLSDTKKNLEGKIIEYNQTKNELDLAKRTIMDQQKIISEQKAAFDDKSTLVQKIQEERDKGMTQLNESNKLNKQLIDEKQKLKNNEDLLNKQIAESKILSDKLKDASNEDKKRTKLELDSKNETIKQLQKNINENNETVENLKNQISTLKTKEAISIKNISDLKNTTIALNNENSKLNLLLSEKEKHIASITGDVGSLETIKNETEKKLSKLTDENNKLQKNIKDLEDASRSLEDAYNLLDQQNKQLKALSEEGQQNIINQKNKEISDNRKEIDKLQKEIENIKNNISKTNIENIQIIEKDISTDERNKYIRTIEQLNEKIQTYQVEKMNLENRFDTLRNQMSSDETSELNNQLNILRDQINVSLHEKLLLEQTMNDYNKKFEEIKEKNKARANMMDESHKEATKRKDSIQKEIDEKTSELQEINKLVKKRIDELNAIKPSEDLAKFTSVINKKKEQLENLENEIRNKNEELAKLSISQANIVQDYNEENKEMLKESLEEEVKIIKLRRDTLRQDYENKQQLFEKETIAKQDEINRLRNEIETLIQEKEKQIKEKVAAKQALDIETNDDEKQSIQEEIIERDKIINNLQKEIDDLKQEKKVARIPPILKDNIDVDRVMIGVKDIDPIVVNEDVTIEMANLENSKYKNYDIYNANSGIKCLPNSRAAYGDKYSFREFIDISTKYLNDKIIVDMSDIETIDLKKLISDIINKLGQQYNVTTINITMEYLKDKVLEFVLSECTVIKMKDTIKSFKPTAANPYQKMLSQMNRSFSNFYNDNLVNNVVPII